jgi:hypothetical protein
MTIGLTAADLKKVGLTIGLKINDGLNIDPQS